MKDDYVHPRGDAPGIELRDWFAGMALSGLVSKYWGDSHSHLDQCDYAEIAYELADEMIKSRNG